MRTTYIEQSQTNVAKVVMDCITAINNGDFETARQYLSDDVLFKGPLGNSNGAYAYLNMLMHSKITFRVKQIFVNGEDVCLLCELAVFSLEISYSGLYQLKQGKITSINAVFDTHSLIELSAKN